MKGTSLLTLSGDIPVVTQLTTAATTAFAGANLVAWIAFVGFILGLVVLDFRYLNRTGRELTPIMKGLNVLIIVSAACLFGFLLLVLPSLGLGGHGAGEYYSAYLSELVLSVDNLFVMAMLIESFRVPAKAERTVLNIGIAGAIVLRILAICLGVSLIQRVLWLGAVFGLILAVTALTSLWELVAPLISKDLASDEEDIEDSFAYKVMAKYLRIPVTNETNDAWPTVRDEDGKRRVTPVGQCMVLLAITGLLFALDSIPVVLSITDNFFVAITSNVMAVMGLLSFYALYTELSKRVPYIKWGVAVILLYVSLDLICSNEPAMEHTLHWSGVELPLYTTPVVISVVLIVTWGVGRAWPPKGATI